MKQLSFITVLIVFMLFGNYVTAQTVTELENKTTSEIIWGIYEPNIMKLTTNGWQRFNTSTNIFEWSTDGVTWKPLSLINYDKIAYTHITNTFALSQNFSAQCNVTQAVNIGSSTYDGSLRVYSDDTDAFELYNKAGSNVFELGINYTNRLYFNLPSTLTYFHFDDRVVYDNDIYYDGSTDIYFYDDCSTSFGTAVFDIGLGSDGTNDRLGFDSNVSGAYFYFDGDGKYTGSWTQFSSKTLKKNVQPMNNILDKVNLISPVFFNWKTEEYKDMNFSTDRQIGVIAEEIENIFPELVINGGDYKSVDYIKLSVIAIQATKELNDKYIIMEKENEELKNNYKNLEEKYNSLSKEIELIKEQLKN